MDRSGKRCGRSAEIGENEVPGYKILRKLLGQDRVCPYLMDNNSWHVLTDEGQQCKTEIMTVMMLVLDGKLAGSSLRVNRILVVRKQVKDVLRRTAEEQEHCEERSQ
jgi:hypothetical protein